MLSLKFYHSIIYPTLLSSMKSSTYRSCCLYFFFSAFCLCCFTFVFRIDILLIYLSKINRLILSTWQNAEDNEYLEGVDPSLEFVITSRDITCTGAPATLLMFNNEVGFSAKNIESICSFAKSTKKGNRKRGYIGEKGQHCSLKFMYKLLIK